MIIHLPASVSRGLAVGHRVATPRSSASGSSTVRGDTDVVVEERRPVPLWQHVMVGSRLLDLFVTGGPEDGQRRVNPELVRLCARRAAVRPGRRPAAEPWRARRRRSGGAYTPSRVDVLDRLDRRGAAAGDRLRVQPGRVRRRGATVPRRRVFDSPRPRSATRSAPSSSERCADIPDEDLHVLGYHEWARRAGARVRRPPRRHAADLQGGRRGAVRPRPGQGRVRDGDARARHQHAGPVGRASSGW